MREAIRFPLKPSAVHLCHFIPVTLVWAACNNKMGNIRKDAHRLPGLLIFLVIVLLLLFCFVWESLHIALADPELTLQKRLALKLTEIHMLLPSNCRVKGHYAWPLIVLFYRLCCPCVDFPFSCALQEPYHPISLSFFCSPRQAWKLLCKQAWLNLIAIDPPQRLMSWVYRIEPSCLVTLSSSLCH